MHHLRRQRHERFPGSGRSTRKARPRSVQAAEAAEALRLAAGEFAFVLFSLGIIAASSVANCSVGSKPILHLLRQD